MMQQNTLSTGLFGKLPPHGDFLHRNLPPRVINEWDKWLQTIMGSSQERLGDAWLETYLTSPIWRFCLSPGTLDASAWAGILLPSVDRVGRYFPFSILRKLPESTPLSSFALAQSTWFEKMEALALKALDGHLVVDRLFEEINQIKLTTGDGYQPQSPVNLAQGVVVDLDLEEPYPMQALPHLLDAFVSRAYSSYSYWYTLGSNQVEPCMFVTPGLPSTAGGAAMLDGLWEHWEWSVPVRPWRPTPVDAPTA